MFDGLCGWCCLFLFPALHSGGSVVLATGPPRGTVARTTATLCCPSVSLAPQLCPLP
jgi:hypothetical protein